jgi:drug/metabolite transporter (DMT)-like permease
VTQRNRGIFLLVGASLVWSLGGILIKSISLGSLAVAGFRSAIAAVVIWTWMRFGRVTITREHLFGAIAYAGTVIFFVLATKNTTAANAILLQYTAPVYVALLSHRLLGEPIERADWITIVVVLCGLVLFLYDGITTGGLLGNLFAIASGVFFALCVISLRLGRDRSSIEMVLLGNITTAAIVGICALCAPILALPPVVAAPIGRDDVLLLLLLGVVQLGIGYIFFVRGVRYVSAMESALIPVVEPLLNPLWVAIGKGELPSPLAMVGGGIVLTAVTWRGVAKVRAINR